MFLVFFLLSSFTAQSFLLFQESLSPVDIFWPKSWVSNNIEPSTNHESSNIIITVHCRVFVDLPSGAEANLIIPGVSYKAINTLSNPKKAGEDLQFQFGFYKLDKGTYGPISLFIRQIANGQILAARAAFGDIAIIDPIPDSTEKLFVSFDVSSKIITEPASLKFSFMLLDTERLEKYDYFVLDLDQSFGYMNGILTWDLGIDDSKLFTDTISEQVGSSIIIYKFLNEIYNGATISFTISGFTNPINIRTANNYSWKLTVHRFGTPTIIKIVTGTGPDEDLLPGTFSFPSWSFVNNYIDKTQVYKNLIIFTELSFILEHDIPKGGIIYIKYKNAEISTSDYYPNSMQTLTFASFVHATISGSNVQLSCVNEIFFNTRCTTSTDNIPRNALVTVYNLVKFYDSAAISMIESRIFDEKEGKEMIIDTISESTLNLKTSIDINSYSQEMTFESLVYFVADKSEANGVNEVGDYGNYGLVMSLKDPIGFNKNDKVSIMLPMKKSSESDLKKVVIEGELYGYYTEIVTRYDSETFSGNYGAVYELNDLPNFVEDKISFSLNIDYLQDEYVNIFIASREDGYNKNFYFPYFPVTKKDMYEIVVKVENFNTGKTFFISKPLSFVYNTQGSLKFRYYCLSDNIEGMPVKFSFIPPFAFEDPNYTIRITFTLYDISYDQIGSGLENGMEYSSFSDYTIFYEHDGSHATLYIELSCLEFNPIASDEENAIIFIVPFKSLFYGDYLSIDAQISAISKTENIKISEIHQEYSYFVSYPEITDQYYETNEDVKFSSDFFSYINEHYDYYTIVFTFDRGFKIRGSTIFINYNNISFNFLNSDNLMFNYAFGYIDSILLPDYLSLYFIFDITTPWFIDSQQQISFAYILKSKEFNDEACYYHKIYRFILNPPKMIYNSYSPSYIMDDPFSVPRFDVSISFEFRKTIYAGSKITAEISTTYFNILKSKWSIKIGKHALNTDECISNPSCYSGKLLVDVTDSNIIITVHDVTLNEISEDYLKFQGFIHVTLYFTDSNNKDYFIQTWANEDSSGIETYFYKASISAGVSNNKKIWVFPSTKGASSVYFKISFTSPYYLPSGTTITVYNGMFETNNYDAKDSTWCNYGFASAKINFYNRLEIVTIVNIYAGETIEIVKDYALSLNNNADESPEFFITAQFRNYYLINDVQNANGKKFLIDDAPNIKITEITISPKIFNKGAKNYYTFSFMLNAEAYPSWFYCFDASHDYDANPGDTFTIQNFEGVLFLYAKSSISENFYCTVSHWIICCTGFNNNIQANNLIDISIYLTNPASSQASFNVYITDENFESVVEPKYEIIVYFSEIPQKIVDAYRVSLANINYRESSSTVIVDAYIDADLIKHSLIQIEFPRPFDLNFHNPKHVYCSIHYDKDDDNYNLIYKDKSEIEMNYVLVDIKNPKKLNTKFWTRFYFENVFLPEFGILKNSQNSIEFEDFDYWTGKFGISIFGKKPYSNDGSIESISKSYPNLNAAYTGFNKNDYKSVIINNRNDIIIKPGTFSPYFLITVDGDLTAYKLTLNPSSYPYNVVKFDAHSYILDLIFPQSKFRIGVNQKTSEGFYIISWNIYEKPLIPGVNCYRTRQKTKIQIFFGEPYKIVPKRNFFVPAGLASLPFLIPFPEATPYLGIKISFISETDNNITFSPNPLHITPETFSAYFTIACEDCISASKYKFKYELSGYNKDVFTINPKGSFVFDSFSTKKDVTGWIKLNIIDQVTASVELITSEDAIVYWALLSKTLFAKNSSYSSIEMIKEVAQSLICNENCYGKTLEDQIYEYANKLRDADDVELSWEKYSQKAFLIAESTYFSNIDYVSAIESSKILYTFKNLIAETEYVVIAYISHLNAKSPIQVISQGVTSKLQNHGKLVINFNSTENINLEKIREIMSNSYKIDIRRIISTQTTKRNLYESALKFTILSSPFSSLSPVSIANINKKLLNNTFISNDYFVLEISNTIEEDSQNFTIPYLQNLEMTNNGYNNVQINFILNTDGIICCEFEPGINSIKNLTYYEVLIGLNNDGENNDDRPLCEKVVAGEPHVFKHKFGNEDYGNYMFICNVCNNYPIRPECAEELIFYEFDWRLEIENCGTFLVFMEFIIALGFIS